MLSKMNLRQLPFKFAPLAESCRSENSEVSYLPFRVSPSDDQRLQIFSETGDRRELSYFFKMVAILFISFFFVCGLHLSNFAVRGVSQANGFNKRLAAANFKGKRFSSYPMNPR
jgi:hypothetical protein